ncbi:MAG: MBL fold metallo-hydrolase [Leptospirales bacterium]
MPVNMELEDQYWDVLKKFRYGRKTGLRALSDQTGIPIDRLREMESGTIIPSVQEWTLLGAAMGFKGNVVERLHFHPEKTPHPTLPASILPVGESYFGYAVWTYLVLHAQDPRRALLIDTGGMGERIANTIQQKDLVLDAVLLTHGHSDHAGDLSLLGKHLPDNIFLHEDDLALLSSPLPPGTHRYSPEEAPERLFPFGWTINVQEASGHTKGSVAYLLNGVLFVGDAIFSGSSGKADRPDTFPDSILSVQRLLSQNDPATLIVSGHGPFTTVGQEREYNPFFNAVPILSH